MPSRGSWSLWPQSQAHSLGQPNAAEELGTSPKIISWRLNTLCKPVHRCRLTLAPKKQEQPGRWEEVRALLCLLKDDTVLLVESKLFFHSQAFDIKN